VPVTTELTSIASTSPTRRSKRHAPRPFVAHSGPQSPIANCLLLGDQPTYFASAPSHVPTAASAAPLRGRSRRRRSRGDFDLDRLAGLGVSLARASHLTSCRCDGIFPPRSGASFVTEDVEIDRLMPIAAEAEQIADRRNSCLKSRARISDGSGRRCLTVRRKICAIRSMRYGRPKRSSGSEGR
jgi:hypothetical protein